MTFVPFKRGEYRLWRAISVATNAIARRSYWRMADAAVDAGDWVYVSYNDADGEVIKCAFPRELMASATECAVTSTDASKADAE